MRERLSYKRIALLLLVAFAFNGVSPLKCALPQRNSFAAEQAADCLCQTCAGGVICCCANPAKGGLNAVAKANCAASQDASFSKTLRLHALPPIEVASAPLVVVPLNESPFLLTFATHFPKAPTPPPRSLRTA